MLLSFNKSIIIRNNKYLIKLLSNQKRYKYLTQSDIEHNSIVLKGSHPMRPNDPRITFNPLLNQNKPIDEKSDEKKSRKEVISKAMTAYLERAKQYDLFINEQDSEFQMGRRHLANIMGVDESLMTQSDIDVFNTIPYLIFIYILINLYLFWEK
jgi:predicted ATP-dependent protease